MNTYCTLLIIFLYTLLSTSCFATLPEGSGIENALDAARGYITQKKIPKSSPDETFLANVKRMEEEDAAFSRIHEGLQAINKLSNLRAFLEDVVAEAERRKEVLEEFLRQKTEFHFSNRFVREITFCWANIKELCQSKLETLFSSKKENASSVPSSPRSEMKNQSSEQQKMRGRVKSTYVSPRENAAVKPLGGSANNLNSTVSEGRKSMRLTSAERVSRAIKRDLFEKPPVPQRKDIVETTAPTRPVTVIYAPASSIDSFDQDQQRSGSMISFNGLNTEPHPKTGTLSYSNFPTRNVPLTIIYASPLSVEDGSFDQDQKTVRTDAKRTPPPVPVRKEYRNEGAV